MSTPILPFLLLLTAAGAAAQPPALVSNNSPDNNSQISFRPSIAVVIGIFSIMFSLTFFLLMYAKFCNSRAHNLLTATGAFFGNGESRRENGRFSGIDKAVIESLPFFRFSALKGAREGLECAICLSRFVDSELLRLLPRCKHAFHMDCIDRWLESHSSCPLCRTCVDADDITFFKFSASSHYLPSEQSGRLMPDAGEQGGGSGLELYVEREHGPRDGSTSRKFAAGLRWALIGKSPPLHNYKHRIVVSDVMFRSRWSDFNSADLISLDSEMHRVMSSRRFEQSSNNPADSAGVSGSMSPEGVSRLKEEMERKRRLESRAVQMQVLAENPEEDYSGENFSVGDKRALISPASRCMSDITEVARYRPSRNHGGRDEKVRQMWLPIAQRTVQLFAGKERRPILRPPSAQDAAENV